MYQDEMKNEKMMKYSGRPQTVQKIDIVELEIGSQIEKHFQQSFFLKIVPDSHVRLRSCWDGAEKLRECMLELG